MSTNATAKGRPNMTGAKFCTWVNTHLLPNAELPPGCPLQIQPRTAIKWLHHLGFRPQSHKKSIYIDGHERADVVEYRKLYLREITILSSTHLRTIVPALESVRLDTIRKYFRKCREYMQAYREGNTGGSGVEKAVQKYKSHRRVFGNVG